MKNTSQRSPRGLVKGVMRGMLQLPGWLRRLGYYGLALLFVAAAAGLRWAMPAVLGPTPFLAFYLAWVGAAVFGGLGPGLLATAASWVCIDLLFDPVNSLVNFSDWTTMGRLVVLLAGGLTVSLVAERMRRGRIRERRQSRELARDIIERKRTEERLRESEEQLRQRAEEVETLMEVAPVAIWVSHDPQCSHIVGNREANSFYEAHGQENVSANVSPVRQFFRNGKELKSEELPMQEAAAEDIDIRNTELDVLLPSGRWLNMLGSASPLRNAQGQVRGCVGTFLDITKRKQAEETLRNANERLQQQAEELQSQAEELQLQTEELTTANEELRDSEQALRESEERFRAAYEQAAIGIEMLDLDGRMLRGNGWLGQMLGYREEELQQRTFAEITQPDDLQEELPLLEKLLAGEIPNYSIEKRYLHKDGHPVWVRVTSSLVCTSAPYRISIIEDVTERRRGEEALRKLNATLENKVAQRTVELEHRARQLQKLTLELSQAEDRERKRLAEILHDDLQQVLAAAKFHLSLMKNRAKYDASVQATATQVDQMLKDAIEKSRSLSHELSPAVLHNGDFAETLEWLAGQVQAKHGLVVHVNAFGEVKSESDALKTFVYKAAQELLFNVVKHARVSEATIRLRRLGRWICLSVSDHGRGFDLQALKETHGFGLLSIRERVELLGGRMKIKSIKDKGSTFSIVVPDGELARSHGEVEPEPDTHVNETRRAEAKSKGGSRLRVLLADDHEIVREGLISLLSEEHGLEIVGEATNGREAVDLAGRLEPDVVVMDVSMPLINGDEATRQIKRHLPNTRVVALSMFEDPETIARMRAAGAEAYVLKTAPSEDLLAAIRGKSSDSSDV